MAERLFCIQEVEGSIPSKSKEKIAREFWKGRDRAEKKKGSESITIDSEPF